MAKSKPSLTVVIPQPPHFKPGQMTGIPTPVPKAMDALTEDEAWYKVFGKYDPRESSVELPTTPLYRPPPIPSPKQYLPTELMPVTADKQPKSEQLDAEMTEQLRRAAFIAAALDRAIARLETVMQGL